METKETIVSDSDYYKVGENIRELRRIHEETREQLAEAVGLTPAAISNYENWHRKPSRDDLLAIAKHYHITVSSLLNDDFSNVHIHTNVLVNSPDVWEYMIERLFPFVYSDEAMENEFFQEAYEIHGELIEKIFLGHDLRSSRVEKCIELYEKAGDTGLIDAEVGILWWLMYSSIGYSITSKKMQDFINKSSSKTTVSDYIQDVFLSSVYDEKDKKEEKEKKEKKKRIKVLSKDILESIYQLKNSNHNQLYALADYYLALCYLFDVIGNELTKEENRKIGHEMLRLGCVLKNEYAIDFCTALDFLDEEN